MKENTGVKKYENYILTLLVVAVNILLMAACFDFYYDLNDDTMMLDIMSGAYSGIPDGHNMQTLYPLGALIALCYRLCGTIPWYGLFLCLCQFGCLYLIGVRLCDLTDKSRKIGKDGRRRFLNMTGKLLVLLTLSLFVWGICLSHMVNIQYTVTAAIMSAAAIFLFFTAPETDDGKRFLVGNLPAVALVIIAYQLRSEMLLLTFPFICLAGLYRLTGEKKVFVKENLFKYGGVLGIMLAGMALSRGMDYAAYGSGEWKDFLRFFEARTTVYDFYPELITEDGYAETLTGLGVAPYQQTLFRNYNYGLDDTIDTELLVKLADYATDTLRGEKDWGTLVRRQVYRYFHRTFRGGDSPYSTMLLWMYAAVIVAGFCMKSQNAGAAHRTGARRVTADKLRAGCGYAFLWQIALLAAGRSAIWMFILLRGRDPERITHSLYLVEFALLAGLMIRILNRSGDKRVGIDSADGQSIVPDGEMTLHDSNCVARNERVRNVDGHRDKEICWDMAWCSVGSTGCGISRLTRYIPGVMTAVFLLILAGGASKGVSSLQDNQAWREEVNKNWYAIDEYCRAHDGSFYFEDVYSTVSFSRKIFDSAGYGYANYDILGGWMCGSPLYHDKTGRYGIVSAPQALLAQDSVYLIMSDLEAAEQGFKWLVDYYDAQNISVKVEKTDTVGDEYSVYRVVGSR